MSDSKIFVVTGYSCQTHYSGWINEAHDFWVVGYCATQAEAERIAQELNDIGCQVYKDKKNSTARNMTVEFPLTERKLHSRDPKCVLNGDGVSYSVEELIPLSI